MCASLSSVTATMCKFVDAIFIRKGVVFGLIGRTFIAAILIRSFEPDLS